MIKLVAKVLLLICFGAVAAQAQTPTSFKHIVVVVQENRTPDNLFQGLCVAPFGTADSCSPTPGPGQYNIQTAAWFDKSVAKGTIKPKSIALANKYDLDHSHSAFREMCDLTSGDCKMDGAAGVNCVPSQKGGVCPSHPQFRFVSNSTGLLNPYLQLATQYGWANYMFQTNQGPSFPAHQFIFGGTSAPTASDDAFGIFASENMTKTGGVGGLKVVAGCTALAKTTVSEIMPDGDESTKIYPCFEHQTMGDLLGGSSITWRYYVPGAGSIWTAPNAIQHICESTGPGGQCTGQEWLEHVDLTSADVLKDIGSCNLQSVTWAVPTCENSDHAGCNDGGGPSWVTSIVNAIGNANTCDGGAGYWNDTAIIITWDDWGGWYDHERPTILPPPLNEYQYGFRVPMIFVSAYTQKGLINNARHDFGSILRFIEQNFGIQQGALNFADARSETNLTGFFDFSQSPRPFQTISAPKNANFFLKDRRPQTDPDDQ